MFQTEVEERSKLIKFRCFFDLTNIHLVTINRRKPGLKFNSKNCGLWEL